MTLTKHLQRFRKNKRGLAYIWIVAVCTIAFMPVVYWIMNVLLDSIAISVFSMTTFSGATADAWLLVKTLITFLMGICLFIILLWAIVNAKAQSYEQ